MEKNRELVIEKLVSQLTLDGNRKLRRLRFLPAK